MLAVFVISFDWIWFRPLIQYVVHERSGRRIDFDALRVSLDSSLRPIVRVRGLTIQNAPWASSTAPMIQAAEVGFAMSWPGLGGEPIVLTRLELIGAVLDLERRTDGLRNWRLLRPDNRGPGQVRVLSIDARDTTARFVDQRLELALELRASVMPAAVTLPSAPTLPLTREIAVTGTRAGTPFTLEGAVSDILHLFDTHEPFALRLELRSGKTSVGPKNALQAEGTVSDLAQVGGADLAVRFAGPRPDEIARLLGAQAAWPSVSAQASARLVKDGASWHFPEWQASIGRSRIAGQGRLDIAGPPSSDRSTLRGVVTRASINLEDVRGPVRPAGAVIDRADPPLARPTLDAVIDFANVAVEGLPIGSASDASGRAVLSDGRWSVEPLSFAFAGGRIAGRLVAETVPRPAAYTLDLRLQGLRLERLARTEPDRRPLDGALDARVSLQTRGDSVARLASGLTGTVQAELVGATLLDSLGAKLSLDGGRVLRNLIGTGERARIGCSALELRFEEGRGSVRRFAFDTPQASFTGAGAIDLGRRSIDLVLTPRRKQTALLGLDRAIQLHGPLERPDWHLIAPSPRPAGEPCVRGAGP